MYTGLLIKESLSDERILDFVEIKNVEIWVTNNNPKYWTAVSFVSDCIGFPENCQRQLVKIRGYNGMLTLKQKIQNNLSFLVFLLFFSVLRRKGICS